MPDRPSDCLYQDMNAMFSRSVGLSVFKVKSRRSLYYLILLLVLLLLTVQVQQ